MSSQVTTHDYADSEHVFFFIGVDFPVNSFLLINASVGRTRNTNFITPIENLMINFGINYKITTNPVNSNKKQL